MSPTASDPELVVSDYTILVDGAAIDIELLRRLTDIRIVDYLALPDLCTFNIKFDTTSKNGNTDPIGKHPFDIGAGLRIRMTPRNKKVAQDVFDGEIVTLEPQFSGGGAELTVRALDRSHRLNRARKVRTFQNQKVSDIVGKVLQEASLSPQVDATTSVLQFMQQSNETDLDFIWRLARRVGYEFSVKGKEGHFKKIGKSAPIELAWPRVLHNFAPKLTAVQQVSEVEVRAWDPKTKKTFVGQASSPRQSASIGISRDSVKNAFPRAKYTVITEPTQSQGEAREIAQALLDKVANAYVTADGVCDGDPRIRAGSMVKVRGVGAKFSGTYRVNSSVHTLSGGSTYSTEFSSSAIQTLTGAMAASKPPEFGSHLVIGIVTNNNDPDGMGRVRVKYPSLSEQEEGYWARVLVPNAGSKERGVMMLPAVDDEVLVGFEFNDPTHPYVLGSLFNGKDKPGNELASTRGDFAIRSDHKMIMRSKEETIISADKDLQIEIKGNGTLTFEQNRTDEVKGQTFKMTGKINVVLEAGAQLSIKGQQVNIEAGGMMNIKSNGQLAIKGSMIDINAPMIKIGGGMVNLG